LASLRTRRALIDKALLRVAAYWGVNEVEHELLLP
jgi:hypothetical protein